MRARETLDHNQENIRRECRFEVKPRDELKLSRHVFNQGNTCHYPFYPVVLKAQLVHGSFEKVPIHYVQKKKFQSTLIISFA